MVIKHSSDMVIKLSSDMIKLIIKHSSGGDHHGMLTWTHTVVLLCGKANGERLIFKG